MGVLICQLSQPLLEVTLTQHPMPITGLQIRKQQSGTESGLLADVPAVTPVYLKSKSQMLFLNIHILQGFGILQTENRIWAACLALIPAHGYCRRNQHVNAKHPFC